MAGPDTSVTEKQRKHLRGLAHGLRPVARLGTSGVTDAFLAEFETVLAHHELIKLKVTAATRADRNIAIGTVVDRTGAVLISRIGNVAVLYRPRPAGARLVFPGD
ncbi:MAG: YhbY family RNA-binding protein [Gammaproteobacteria bacterium]